MVSIAFPRETLSGRVVYFQDLEQPRRTFARHWYTGMRCGAVFERAKTTISKERYTAMSHPGRVPRAGLASFLTHLCAALVHREAFFDEISEWFLSTQKR